MTFQIKKYLKITKNSFLVSITYRFHFIFSFVSSLFYFIIFFFLWNAIFQSAGKEIINGMNFTQVIVYISLSYSIFVLFKNYIEWRMSRNIVSGQFMMDLIKPYNIYFSLLANSLGFVLMSFITITIPTILIMFFFFNSAFPTGISIFFFIISIILAYLISFNIDYFVGLTSFYTESVWGISITKDVIIMIFSGIVIPLSFYPDTIESILILLPFAAMYHIPVSIFITHSLSIANLIMYFIIQLFWIIFLFILNTLFFKKAIKVITINGG